MTIEQATNVLSKHLPETAYRRVWNCKHFDGSTSVAVMFAASEHKINDVNGQYPLCVSLWVTNNTLKPQIFAGKGGNYIYFKRDENNPKEKYSALKRVDIPFRKGKPTANEKQLARFCTRWVQAIKDNEQFIQAEYPANYDAILTFNSPKI